MTDPTTVSSNLTSTRVTFSPRYSVDAELCEAIARQVTEIIPALSRDAAYTLERLCGEVFWQPLSAGERRRAGRCMVWLVANSRLPLCFADSRHEYPKYYRLM